MRRNSLPTHFGHRAGAGGGSPALISLRLSTARTSSDDALSAATTSPRSIGRGESPSHSHGKRSVLSKLLGRASLSGMVKGAAPPAQAGGVVPRAASALDSPGAANPAEAPRERLALSPVSTARARWDLLIVVFVLYNAVVLPFRLGFGDNEFGPLSIIDCVIDGFFLIDMVLSFNTGFIPDGGGTPERRLSVARRRYLRQMFLVDLVASVPADLALLLDTGGSVKMRMYLRLPRLLRLLRLPRLFRYLRRWVLYMGAERASQLLQWAKIVFGIVMFPHLDACILFFLQAIQEFPDTGWVTCEGLEDASKLHQYTYALFIATSHMLCIGYGPACYSPSSSAELWVTISSMIVGASLYIVLIAAISSSFLAKSVEDAKGMLTERLSADGLGSVLYAPCSSGDCTDRQRPASLGKQLLGSAGGEHRFPTPHRRGSLVSLECKLDAIASTLASVATDLYALTSGAVSGPPDTERPSLVSGLVVGRPSTDEEALAQHRAKWAVSRRSAWGGLAQDEAALAEAASIRRRLRGRFGRSRVNSWPCSSRSRRTTGGAGGARSRDSTRAATAADSAAAAAPTAGAAP